MNNSEKKYCIVYDDLKAIKLVVFNQSSIIYTNFNLYSTNTYNDLVNFIYENNLYFTKQSNIDYDSLEIIDPNIKETLFKYDD